MTSEELVNKIAEHFNVSRTDAEHYVNEIFAAISKCLSKGKNVNINGFGKFIIRERKKDDKKIKMIYFSPSRNFSEEVNEEFSNLHPYKIKTLSPTIKIPESDEEFVDLSEELGFDYREEIKEESFFNNREKNESIEDVDKASSSTVFSDKNVEEEKSDEKIPERFSGKSSEIDSEKTDVINPPDLSTENIIDEKIVNENQSEQNLSLPELTDKSDYSDSDSDLLSENGLKEKQTVFDFTDKKESSSDITDDKKNDLRDVSPAETDEMDLEIKSLINEISRVESEIEKEKKPSNKELEVFNNLVDGSGHQEETTGILSEELKALHDTIVNESTSTAQVPSVESELDKNKKTQVNINTGVGEKKEKVKEEPKRLEDAFVEIVSDKEVKNYDDIFAPVKSKTVEPPPEKKKNKLLIFFKKQSALNRILILSASVFIFLLIAFYLIRINVGSDEDFISGNSKTTEENIIPRANNSEAETSFYPNQDRIVYTEKGAVFRVTPKGYVVQVASFDKQEFAEIKSRELKDKKIPVYIEKYEVPDGKIYYRVIAGPYKTLDEAKVAIKDL